MPKPRSAKPSEPYTKFGPWFKKQFGYNLLSNKAKEALQRKAMAEELSALSLSRKCLEEDRRDDVHDAALKGWVAGYEAGKYEALKGKK